MNNTERQNGTTNDTAQELLNKHNSELEAQLVETISWIVADDRTHGRWLNSLSLMENSGARKISAAQHPTLVTEQLLRHMLEETRHAWYLKRQIRKLASVTCPTYESRYLVAPTSTRQYLDKLDVAVSRLAKTKLEITGAELRSACYLLVTYAIEVTADLLYGIYERILQEHSSEITVRTILADEENHLTEMTTAIANGFDDPEWWTAEVCRIERNILSNWLADVQADVQTKIAVPSLAPDRCSSKARQALLQPPGYR